MGDGREGRRKIPENKEGYEGGEMLVEYPWLRKNIERMRATESSSTTLPKKNRPAQKPL